MHVVSRPAPVMVRVHVPSQQPEPAARRWCHGYLDRGPKRVVAVRAWRVDGNGGIVGRARSVPVAGHRGRHPMLGDEARLVQRGVARRRDCVRAGAVVAPPPEQKPRAVAELRRRHLQRMPAAGPPTETGRRGHALAVHDDLEAGRIGGDHVLGRDPAIEPRHGVDVAERQLPAGPEGHAGWDRVRLVGAGVVPLLPRLHEVVVHDRAVVVRADVAPELRLRMPGVPGVRRRCDVVAEHGQPAVTIPSLLLVLQADRVAQDVQQVADGIGLLDDQHLRTRTAFGADPRAGNRTEGETQVVLVARPPPHEPQDRPVVPDADCPHDDPALARRHVVVNDIRNDSARPGAEETGPPVARRHGVPHVGLLRGPPRDLLRRPEDDVARVDRQSVHHFVGQLGTLEERGPRRRVVLGGDEGTPEQSDQGDGERSSDTGGFEHGRLHRPGAVPPVEALPAPTSPFDPALRRARARAASSIAERARGERLGPHRLTGLVSSSPVAVESRRARCSRHRLDDVGPVPARA